jgi:hypothetical protein
VSRFSRASTSLAMNGRQYMTFRRIVVVLGMGAILMGLAYSTSVWAAPGQSPARQTLPTKTPVVPPQDDKDTPTPVATFISPTSTPVGGTSILLGTPTAGLTPVALPQALPSSGAQLTFPVGFLVAGAVFVLIGWVARRRTN